MIEYEILDEMFGSSLVFNEITPSNSNVFSISMKLGLDDFFFACGLDSFFFSGSSSSFLAYTSASLHNDSTGISMIKKPTSL